MKEDQIEPNSCQKFLNGVLAGIEFVALIALCIVIYIIIILLVPFFLYPFVMFFGNTDLVCYFYSLCLVPVTMMTLWVMAFIILPPIVFGILSCVNIVHAKPVSTCNV